MQRLVIRVLGFFNGLSKREKLLILMLISLLGFYLFLKFFSGLTNLYLFLKTETPTLNKLIDTYLTLERKRKQMELIKASLEEAYRNFIWESEDVGELTRFEQIKTGVSKEGIVLDQFRVEIISTERFSDELTKIIYRVSFNSNRLSGVVNYLMQLFSGDHKALPLKITLEKKASNDGLIASFDLLVLKKS